ncbi:dienelactone hydrolase family protein [Actinomadura sp. ATCC 31491]|uniref:Dienelactone hydrolase family protein n=1 Tax=Actinomadura luzonensis TaxID=2805427 RepID=A0ABT0GCN1_9ACTN|nr:dienelactone hydrolase family protein [Actinomadura luzonensis]MCK2221866.1 dienelactone hydrolase family protein [Actinomadura luzonensis]
MFRGLAAVAEAQLGVYPAPTPALRRAVREAIGVLDLRAADVHVERAWTDGDLAGEELSWDVGFGPRTHAFLLRPRAATGPLPGVVALHCHASMKWAGKEKIADAPEGPTPEVARLRAAIYGGRAFANALARRGFVVLAHDVFAWGSRRLPLDLPPGEESEADRYDAAARAHEHVLAKHCAVLGTSFAGVVAAEDLAAAAYLRSRPDVARVGCAGLSGGGLRAALLGAFDERVDAVVVAAMATSYRDLLDGHVARHTWMFYPPGLPRLADYPDLVAARAPAPLMVQYATRDELFPAAGMRRAHETIAARYRDAPEAYEAVFADVPHSFDVPMQERAFDWLARHLGG